MPKTRGLSGGETPPPKRRKSTGDVQIQNVLDCLANIERAQTSIDQMNSTFQQFLKGMVADRTVKRAQNSLLKLSASASLALADCRGQVKKVSKFPYIEKVFQRKKEELLSNPTPSAFKTPPRSKRKASLLARNKLRHPLARTPKPPRPRTMSTPGKKRGRYLALWTGLFGPYSFPNG